MREGVCSEPSIVQARTVHMLQDYKSFPSIGYSICCRGDQPSG